MISAARRALVGLAFALALAACGRAAERCATCGMRVDPASPFVATLERRGVVARFDAPRCAFEAWAREPDDAVARFTEYYARRMTIAAELRFVEGSDVVGPMGPDVVPVAAGDAERFVREHHGKRVLDAAEALREVRP